MNAPLSYHRTGARSRHPLHVKFNSVRDIPELEATIVGKYVGVSPVLDERSRRRWAAAESMAIGYGGDALVASAIGLARETIRKGHARLCDGLDSPLVA